MLSLQEAKSLIQEYYGFFYLDISPSRMGIWGGFALVSALLFFLMLGFSIYVYFLGVEQGALAVFCAVLIFECATIACFHMEANSQLKLAVRGLGFLGVPEKEFKYEDLDNYKLSWIKKRFSIVDVELSGFCERLESIYLTDKRYEEAASGRYGSSLKKFFSVPKDRFIALLLAYFSMLVVVAGSSEFNLDKFFDFYGDLTGYFGFSLAIFLFFLAIVVMGLALATPVHLVVNCIWHSLTKKSRVCTRMTFYIFLRDCNRLAKI